ncbi:DUF4125 family protein [Bifidobacterium choloepi]|uniref:DUF4125 family protein n=1 Tax=Bifidobacterium choloepi TaxID=2614131 RepID=A0A6I5N1V4_9BIFI|nr:DUF4125 family protein [Bifidobacterium choloepi]NEG69609.1 DUF4125 family protein [Bifidobacterium choloepi]
MNDSSVRTTAPAEAQATRSSTREDLIEAVIRAEWDQFQRTNNEGGRAACQGNWPVFHVMRLSQFATWPDDLLASYLGDLQDADRTGRNLVTEKYARMMASTAPEAYRAEIAPQLEAAGIVLDFDGRRRKLQERIVRQQVDWADGFRRQYPKLGEAMRVLRTADDSSEQTSFETYLRGELSTYSDATLDKYARFVEGLADRGENLTTKTVLNTALLAGYDSLDAMEAADASAQAATDAA